MVGIYFILFLVLFYYCKLKLQFINGPNREVSICWIFCWASKIKGAHALLGLSVKCTSFRLAAFDKWDVRT